MYKDITPPKPTSSWMDSKNTSKIEAPNYIPTRKKDFPFSEYRRLIEIGIFIWAALCVITAISGFLLLTIEPLSGFCGIGSSAVALIVGYVIYVNAMFKYEVVRHLREIRDGIESSKNK